MLYLLRIQKYSVNKQVTLNLALIYNTYNKRGREREREREREKSVIKRERKEQINIKRMYPLTLRSSDWPRLNFC